MRKIYYGKAVYNNKEIKAVNRVLKNNKLNLIDVPHVKKIEKIVPKIFGKKYGLMVNSGSSANLLALNSFNFKKLMFSRYSTSTGTKACVNAPSPNNLRRKFGILNAIKKASALELAPK